MPAAPTTKWSLPTMAGADVGNTIDDWTVAFGAAVDSKLAPSDQGALASRPVSTIGSPGKSGRTYLATDTGVLYRDNGTGWDTILTGAGQAATLGVNTDGVVRRGKSIIPGSESTSSLTFASLPTPDRVQNVVLPTDGMIFVQYRATWSETQNNVALAAIFIGSTQMQVQTSSGPLAQAAFTGATFTGGTGPNQDHALISYPGGLASGADTASATGTTGTALAYHPAFGGPGLSYFIAGSGIAMPPYVCAGGACAIEAAAGTYDISILFRTQVGGKTVTVKNRKLWVWTMAF